MSEVVDFAGEQEDAFSDSAIEGEYNFNNTQRSSEPDTKTISSMLERQNKWRTYQKGLQKGQTHRRLINATKSRDANAIKAVLSEHFFGSKNEATEHLESILPDKDGKDDDTDRTQCYTVHLLGLSDNTLAERFDDEKDEDEEDDEDRYEKMKTDLKQFGYVRHLELLETVMDGRNRKLENELALYQDQKELLRQWPVNFGVFEPNFDKRDNPDPRKQGILRHEWEYLQASLEKDFELIDKRLGKFLLGAAKYCKEESIYSNGRYNSIKAVLTEALNLEQGDIEEEEGIPERIESRVSDISEIGENGERVVKPKEPKKSNPSTLEDEEWSDEDPDDFKQEDAKSNRRKQKAEENVSQLRNEIEEAVIMLQMLRIKSALNFARIFEEKGTTSTKKKKAYFKVAVKECEEFLQDAKHAHNAAKEIVTERRKKQEKPKQVDVRPTYQASGSQKKQLKIQQEMRERKRLEEERKNYIYHKGRKMKANKQDPWTKRDNWETKDQTRQDQFKAILVYHSDLEGYMKRLHAAIEELYTDLAAAKKEDKDLQRTAMPRRSLDLDRNTMSEVRRYVNPPMYLHGIVQAMMLLLEEDEYATMEWSHCKALLNPHSDARGNMGLTKRILQFDNTRVDPRIARRVKDILDEIPFDDALKTSPAAGAYYVWTMGVIDEMKNGQFINKDSSTVPAIANMTMGVIDEMEHGEFITKDGTTVPAIADEGEGATPDEQLEIFHKPARKGSKGARRRDQSPNKAGGMRYGGYYNAQNRYSRSPQRKISHESAEY